MKKKVEAVKKTVKHSGRALMDHKSSKTILSTSRDFDRTFKSVTLSSGDASASTRWNLKRKRPSDDSDDESDHDAG